MTRIYAHRGASASFPENTLTAFRAALAADVAGIELDVHVTADRVPVVIHDRDLARTTNGQGHVDEMPLARLRALDAGGGQPVPTLAEVLELVGDAAQLDIEVKGLGIEREVLAALAAHPEVRWAISSFDWDTLRTLRRLDAAAELWPLADRAGDDLLAVAAALGSPAVALLATSYTPASAAALRDAGFAAMIWTVNDAAEARRVRDLGAFALCTDDPERIIAAFTDA
jgi:glycerophosphoryl diester phosphodiesterase